MSEYKPLTDVDLNYITRTGVTPGDIRLLVEQARRANALAAAAFAALREPVDATDAEDSLHTLNEAVARYNGEDGSD